MQLRAGDMDAKGATRPRRRSVSFAAAKSTPLMEILLNDKYAVDRQDFECHLMHEFSLENILFFQVRKCSSLSYVSSFIFGRGVRSLVT